MDSDIRHDTQRNRRDPEFEDRLHNSGNAKRTIPLVKDDQQRTGVEESRNGGRQSGTTILQRRKKYRVKADVDQHSHECNLHRSACVMQRIKRGHDDLHH